jgi:hypothetical protein
VTIKNKFAALENLDDDGDSNKTWDTIRENIKISAKESIGLVNRYLINHGLMRNV